MSAPVTVTVGKVRATRVRSLGGGRYRWHMSEHDGKGWSMRSAWSWNGTADEVVELLAE